MKRRNKQPTTLELIQTTRSQVSLMALLRTGSGPHADKRRSKARRSDWKRDALTAE